MKKKEAAQEMPPEQRAESLFADFHGEMVREVESIKTLLLLRDSLRLHQRAYRDLRRKLLARVGL